jgi:1,4-alpha-glucan branching enzyme
MMRKKRHDSTGVVRVTFELPAAITAQTLALCGEFNDWSTTSSLMHQIKNGCWRTTVALEGGRRYRYRYLADGERWINDWAADAYAPNPFGGDDSVVCL